MLYRNWFALVRYLCRLNDSSTVTTYMHYKEHSTRREGTFRRLNLIEFSDELCDMT